MEDDDSIFKLVDSETDHSETNRPVADRSVADRPVTDRPVANSPVTDRPVANRPTTDRPVSNQSVTDRSLVDRSLIERSYSGYLDRSVADRSMPDRSQANRLIDHIEMPHRSSDNRYDNISSNISYYIRILKTYITFDIYLLLLLSQGTNYRGTRAGFYRQQERFMRFLYRLSSAHYNWGRRGRRSFEDNRSNNENK